MASERRKEQIKLRATFINNLGVAVFAAGVLTPIVTIATSNDQARDTTLAVLAAIACFVLSFVLHVRAMKHLEEME